MLEIIEITINKESTRSKGYSQSQFQRCFAIKSNLNPSLDVARTIYSELIEEFYGNHFFYFKLFEIHVWYYIGTSSFKF